MQFLRSWFNQYNTTGRMWLGLGIIAVVVDAAIGWQYGKSVSFWHAMGFALCAIVFAWLPDAAHTEIERRKYGTGIALWIGAIFLGATAFYAHLGYQAGLRVGSIQQTSVANAKFEDTQDTAKENKANLEMWKGHLAKLQADNPWAATVNPDGLRAQLAVMDKDIELETKRGGCGPKCRTLMSDKAKLEERIAIAAQAGDLGAKIEATQRLVDKAREKVAATDYKSDLVTNQTDVGAQLWLAFSGADPSVAIRPDETTRSFTNLLISANGSLAFLLMAPLGFFVAGRNRVDGRSAQVSHETQVQNGSHTIVERVTENMGALEVLAAYRRPRIA